MVWVGGVVVQSAKADHLRGPKLGLACACKALRTKPIPTWVSVPDPVGGGVLSGSGTHVYLTVQRVLQIDRRSAVMGLGGTVRAVFGERA